MTNITEDDNGDCDYQDDWGGWGGWDDQDHRHCKYGDFGDQDDQGGWDKVNDSMTGIPVATRMARVTMMNLR